MAFVTANKLPVLSAVIALPRRGVWVADLVVDSADALEGAVTIEIAGGKITLRGTAARTGTHRETAHLRVVGGAGGLGKEVPPHFYRQAPARLLLDDVLKVAGERL